MNDELEYRRKRLRFRAWHRGTKEADLLLGPFADAHLDGLDADGLSCFEALLARSDPEIMDWMTGAAEPPDDPVVARLVASVSRAG
ncbi:MAG: succinate dehydrogenase assembly factor 2 [Alphaproteobacteria bacterium]|nr:succinate dehydrogenase assembly factor 2 [Alphaproteobacteria bacterium]